MQKIIPFKGDAFAIFRKFSGKKGLFFLDSSLKSKDGVCSFMGFSPKKIITGTRLDDFRLVLSWQKRLRAKAVGFISYEGSFHFGLYANWISIDHAKGLLYLHAGNKAGLNDLQILLDQSKPTVPILKPQRFKLESNFNKKTYIAAVKEILHAIKRGDVYQINLSRMISAKLTLDPIVLYAALRQHSPSPFAAYYDGGGEQILSSSPERFFKLKGRSVEVKPMKGTRPRGTTKALDSILKKDLEKNVKEIAELLMVTDLERNDLGRVCDFGTVKVKAMRTIEEYATVFQATSTITGTLRKDCDALSLIQATFPSGSVTGCPKIEAMKIIKNIEKIPRGFYTGALGHLDVNGDMDLSVLIRSILVTPSHVRYHVGGGIVADSDPAQEYAETCVKAEAMERAIKQALAKTCDMI